MKKFAKLCLTLLIVVFATRVSYGQMKNSSAITHDTTLEKDAIELLVTPSNGKLGTRSYGIADIRNYPFVTEVPYCIHKGIIYIYIDQNADHTRNIDHDPRISFLLSDDQHSSIPHAEPRITLIGQAIKLTDKNELASAEVAYRQRFNYYDMFNGKIHKFVFYKLTVKRFRYNGGFGRAGWLNPKIINHDIESKPYWVDNRQPGHM